MKKREFKVGIIFLVFIIGVVLLFLSNNKKDQYIKLSNVKIENKKLLLLSDTNQNKCIDDLIEYLNKEYYYECKKIVFYNNQEDKNNEEYFYALVVGGDNSLIEITNLGNGSFKFRYIGNELTEDAKSKITGVSYKQIVNYDEYKKEKELEKVREEGLNAAPDDTEMP